MNGADDNASGCAALTGIEAVANGVTVFKPPVSKNAATVLYVLAGLLTCLFLGVTLLSYSYGVLPREGETMLSQLGRTVFGSGTVYYIFQAATMAILVLAANTSFAGFPRLASIMGRKKSSTQNLVEGESVYMRIKSECFGRGLTNKVLHPLQSM